MIFFLYKTYFFFFKKKKLDLTINPEKSELIII